MPLKIMMILKKAGRTLGNSLKNQSKTKEAGVEILVLQTQKAQQLSSKARVSVSNAIDS